MITATRPTPRAATRPPGRAHRGDRPQRGEPDPRRLVEAVARAYLEIEAGRRPLRQIAPLLAPAVRVRLESPQTRRYGAGPDVSSVVGIRCSEVGDGKLDAAIVVRRGSRVGALVVRVERHRGAWRVTEIARPEDVNSCTPSRHGTEPVRAP